MKTDELIRQLSRDVKPVHALASTSQRLVQWLLIALAAMAIGVFFFGVRSDLSQKLGNYQFLVEVLVILAIAVACASGALIMSVPAQENKTLTKWLPIVGVGAWLVLIFVRIIGSGSFHIDCGFSCIRDIAILGFAPGVSLLWMVKKAAPVRLQATGALLTLASAALGCLGVQFLCQNDEAMHVLLWHAAPALTLGLMGFFGGRLLLRWWFLLFDFALT